MTSIGGFRQPLPSEKLHARKVEGDGVLGDIDAVVVGLAVGDTAMQLIRTARQPHGSASSSNPSRRTAINFFRRALFMNPLKKPHGFQFNTQASQVFGRSLRQRRSGRAAIHAHPWHYRLG